MRVTPPENRRPIFTELCEHEPRLLQPLRVPSLRTTRPSLCRGLYLNLHLGQLQIEPNAAAPEQPADELVARLTLEEPATPQGAVVDDEEDPWWTLMGSPLTAVWAVSPGAGPLQPGPTPERSEQGTAQTVPPPLAAGLDLQFRRSDSNPKIVELRLHEGEIRISVRRPSRP